MISRSPKKTTTLYRFNNPGLPYVEFEPAVYYHIYQKDFPEPIPQDAIYVNYFTLIQCPRCGKWRKVIFPKWDEGLCKGCKRRRCQYCGQDKAHFGGRKNLGLYNYAYCSRACELKAKYGEGTPIITELRGRALRQARKSKNIDRRTACKLLSCDVSVQYLHKVADGTVPPQQIAHAEKLVRLIEKVFQKTNRVASTKGKVGAALHLARIQVDPTTSRNDTATIAKVNLTTLRKYITILKRALERELKCGKN